MINELQTVEYSPEGADSLYKPLVDAHIYSPWSTIAPSELEQHRVLQWKNTNGETNHQPEDQSDVASTANELKQQSLNLTVHRPTATDDTLTKQLKEELRFRGVTAGEDAIALISEWDTSYGRSLPNQFRKLVSAIPPAENQGSQDESKCEPNKSAGRDVFSNVFQYSYLRGLDGQAQTRTTSSDAAQLVKVETLASIEQSRGQFSRRLRGSLGQETARRRPKICRNWCAW